MPFFFSKSVTLTGSVSEIGFRRGIGRKMRNRPIPAKSPILPKFHA
jgi:hypothetical protein